MHVRPYSIFIQIQFVDLSLQAGTTIIIDGGENSGPGCIPFPRRYFKKSCRMFGSPEEQPSDSEDEDGDTVDHDSDDDHAGSGASDFDSDDEDEPLAIIKEKATAAAKAPAASASRVGSTERANKTVIIFIYFLNHSFAFFRVW